MLSTMGQRDSLVTIYGSCFLLGAPLLWALFLGKPSCVVEGYGREESLVGLLPSDAR
jgi:hypothetical protein